MVLVWFLILSAVQPASHAKGDMLLPKFLTGIREGSQKKDLELNPVPKKVVTIHSVNRLFLVQFIQMVEAGVCGPRFG